MAGRDGNGDDEAGPADYKVGYGKPPLHSRFKKGQSGNPKGRPKKPKPDAATTVEKILSTAVTVRCGGNRFRVSAQEAAALREVDDALRGNQQATAALLRRIKKLKVFVVPGNEPSQPRGVLFIPPPLTDEEFEQKLAELQERQAKVPEPSEATPRGEKTKQQSAARHPRDVLKALLMAPVNGRNGPTRWEVIVHQIMQQALAGDRAAKRNFDVLETMFEFDKLPEAEPRGGVYHGTAEEWVEYVLDYRRRYPITESSDPATAEEHNHGSDD